MKYLSLIPKNLLKNKRRTILIAIGIMLSAFLLTTMNISLNNYKEKAYKTAVELAGGDYHGSNTGFELKYLGWTSSDSRIIEVGRSINLGYAVSKDNKYKIKISAFSPETQNMLLLKVQEGKYPSEDGEVALEGWILKKFYPDAKIGDKINVTYEKSIIEISGEKHNLGSSVELTLVGILKDRYNSITQNTGIACLTEKYIESIVPSEFQRYDTFIKTNKIPTQEGIFSIAATNGVTLSANQSLIKYYKQEEGRNLIMIALTVIILIAAAALVNNIYSIIIVERQKELGLLRVVGAEPKHIIILIMGETLVLSILCIPVGIFLGIQGTALLNILTKNSISDGTISIPILNIAIIFLLCLIAVGLSSLKPAISAGKIPPLSAINYTEMKTIKSKHRGEKYQLTNKINFTTGYSFLNIKRHKKRFFTTIASLAISIMVFIISIGVIKYLDPTNLIQSIGSDYILKVNFKFKYIGFGEETVEKIQKLDGIKKVEAYRYVNGNLTTSGNLLSEDYKERAKGYIAAGSKGEYLMSKNLYWVGTEVYGLNDRQLKELAQYVKDGTLDLEELKNSNKALLFSNSNFQEDVLINCNDEIQITHTYKDDSNNFINKDEKIEIQAILKGLNFPVFDNLVPTVLIFHEDTLKKITGLDGYQAIRINKVNKDVATLEGALKELAENQTDGELVSLEEETRLFQEVSKGVKVVLYSFVFTIMIIGIINILNTVTMNILLNKKEAAMLRATGLSQGEYKIIIIKEAIIYGIVSATIGVTLGLLIYSLGLKIFSKVPFLVWSIDLWTIIITYLLSIIICILASLPPMRRIMTSSIIEDIRTID